MAAPTPTGAAARWVVSAPSGNVCGRDAVSQGPTVVDMGSRRGAGRAVSMTVAMRSAVDPDRAREVAGAVRDQRQADLAMLHKEMFRAPGQYRDGMELAGVTRQSVTRRWVRVSVVVSTADLDEVAAATGQPAPVESGVREIHVSVGGHHRLFPRHRTGLPAAEEEGWVRAVFGPAWEDSAYYAGHAATGGTHPLAHYVLFLGPDRRPVPVPVDWRRAARAITEPAPGPSGTVTDPRLNPVSG